MYLFCYLNVGIFNDCKFCCYFAGIHFLFLITKSCSVNLWVITTGEKQKLQGKTFCVLGVRKRMEKRIKSKRPGTVGGYSFPYSGDCCVYRGTLSLLLSPAAEQTGHLRTNIEHSESNSLFFWIKFSPLKIKTLPILKQLVYLLLTPRDIVLRSAMKSEIQF